MDSRMHFANKMAPSSDNVTLLEHHGFAIKRTWHNHEIVEWLFIRARDADRLCMWNSMESAAEQATYCPTHPAAKVEAVSHSSLRGSLVEFMDYVYIHRDGRDRLHVADVDM